MFKDILSFQIKFHHFKNSSKICYKKVANKKKSHTEIKQA